MKGNEKDRPLRSDLVDLTGMRVGEWTVLEAAGLQRFKRARPQRLWRCRCTCGAEVEVRGQALRNATSTRCRACSHVALGKRFQRRIEGGRTFNTIAAASGLKPDTVMRRYRRGWPLWALGAAPGVMPRGLGVSRSVRPTAEAEVNRKNKRRK
jgi:hypothetical protein